MTNARVRYSDNSSRDAGTGLKINGLYSGVIENIQIDDFTNGFDYEYSNSDDSNVRLTNARVRYADNSSRDAETGIIISGVNTAVIDSLLIDGFPNGIEYESSDNAEVRLTNARVRYSDNSSRDGETGIFINGIDYGLLDSLLIEGFSSGIEYESSNDGSVRLTNARVRYSDNSSLVRNKNGKYQGKNTNRRDAESGIKISNMYSVKLDSLFVEEYTEGLIIIDQDSLSLERSEFKNCETALKIENGADQQSICYNTIFRDSHYSYQAAIPAISVTNSPVMNIVNQTIFGYETGLFIENSSVEFLQNIVWSDSLLTDPIIIQNGNIDATYNDISYAAVYPGMGNINSDPLFIDPQSGDFYLFADSPCIDAGDPNSALDPDGSIADIGAVFLDQSGSNISPVLILPIDDISCLEDFEESITLDLYEHFFDANGYQLSFIADYDEQEIDINITDNVLSINPVLNWFGTASVTVTADDNLRKSKGNRRSYTRDSVAESFILFVEAVNDPPEVIDEIEDFTIPEDTEEPVTVSLEEHFNDIESDTLYFDVEYDSSRVFAEIIEVNLFIEIIPGWIGQTAVIVSVSDEPINLIRETCVDTFLITVEDVIPEFSRLYQNKPNPFKNQTTLYFDIKKAGFVQIDVYNIKGQHVSKLVSDHYEPGRYEINWNGKNQRGKLLSSGIYFYQIQAKDYREVKKAVFIR